MFKIPIPLFFIACFCCLCCLSSNAQISISGRIVDEKTGSPIPGASIYFNNTSIGTSSNANGQFSFNSIEEINTELIVSSVGYEILVFKLDAATANGQTFLCKMTVKEQQLKDVLVLSDVRKRRWLALFRENFLGLTLEAEKCSLLNEQGIYFTKGDNNSSFKAYCDTPLVIINKMLGYKLYFELIEFSYDEASGRTYFYGYTRYEEMGDKRRWTKNRRNTYYGSTLHFFRSLIKDQLKQEGFDIYVVSTAKKDGGSSQPSVARQVAATQIISVDSANANFFRVTVPGKLMVQYNNQPESKNFLLKKRMVHGNMPKGFRAFIVLSSPYFLLDQNGILENPLSVEVADYWMYEKAANLLPNNYQPE